MFSKQHIEDYPAICEHIVRILKNKKVITLKGGLGSGKTTFVKSLMNLLESRAVVSSPTFSLVNEYDSAMGTIYHMDLYRLNSVDQAIEIGLLEYLDSGFVCLIEWPELIEELIGDDYMEVVFTEEGSDTRNIQVNIHHL